MRHPLIDADIKAQFPRLKRRSEIIAAMKAMLEKLRAENHRLKAAMRLVDAGIVDELEEVPIGPAWTSGLTPQEIALVSALNTAFPRSLNRLQIMDCIHGHDHAHERDPRLAGVLVCRARKKLGFEAIDTVHGAGWKLSHAFRATMSPDTSTTGTIASVSEAA
jgi:DNA-binding response OmpR family regulator